MLNKFNHVTKILWNTKGAVALALMAIILSACNTNQPQASTPAPPAVNTPASPVGNVTTD